VAVMTATRTCKINDDDCSEDGRITRGWCTAHYARWLRNGDPLITNRNPVGAVCAINSADCATGGRLKRGWCSTHYGRWLKYGDPLAEVRTPAKPYGDALCKVGSEDCSIGGPLIRGYCGTHYQRLQIHGDPLFVLPAPKGEDHPHWSGDDISYKGMHRRLERERGKASSCVNGCLDAPRYEWAHIHDTDPHSVSNPDHSRGLWAGPGRRLSR
jgi:hypothetical protein